MEWAAHGVGIGICLMWVCFPAAVPRECATPANARNK